MSIVHQAPPLIEASPAVVTAAVEAAATTERIAAPTTASAQPPAPTTTEVRRAALEAIAAEVSVCTRCPLHRGRTNAVPGEGHPDTEVVFVGEGPGFNEDQQARPFVGAAGKFLDELIRSIGWRRSDVFITNVVKCRPPGNRDPEPDEIAACAPYLRRQLEVLDPALIVTLGRFSMQTFMPGARVGQVHGTVQPVDPSVGARAAKAYAMYHPASAFRQQALRQTIQLDMTGIPRALVDAREARSARSSDPTPELPDTRPKPQQAPGTVPVDEPPPTAPDPEPQPIPIDDPLIDPEPAPAPLPAGVSPSRVTDLDDQLGMFR
jgi:DNA polymerase